MPPVRIAGVRYRLVDTTSPRMIGAASHETNCGDPTLLDSMRVTTRHSANGGKSARKDAPLRVARIPSPMMVTERTTMSGVASVAAVSPPGPHSWKVRMSNTDVLMSPDDLPQPEDRERRFHLQPAPRLFGHEPDRIHPRTRKQAYDEDGRAQRRCHNEHVEPSPRTHSEGGNNRCGPDFHPHRNGEQCRRQPGAASRPQQSENRDRHGDGVDTAERTRAKQDEEENPPPCGDTASARQRP